MKHTFVLNKRKIIVFATIKGIGIEKIFKFILDTGASKSIIDDGVILQLGFDSRKLENERLTTVGGGANSKILKLPKFSLFGKDIVNFEVNVLNIPPQILYFADGLVGMDFLLQFKNLNFDFDEKIIET
jgi:predicted aspartyl protease